MAPTAAVLEVEDDEQESLIGTITIISDEEPACAAAGNCDEVAEDGLDASLGRNGTVNVTDVAVSSVAASEAGVASTAVGGGRRVLFVAGDASGDNNNVHLRGGARSLQEAAANQTQTEIDYVSGPEASSNMTASQQAAEQVNTLAETGIADLLEELGLPADSEVTIGTTKFAQSESSVLNFVFLCGHLFRFFFSARCFVFGCG